MSASKRSLHALDVVNVFMADVKDGVGVYLSVYLLTVQHWEPSRIGLVVALPWLVSIVVQAPIGSLIDRTRHKRLLLVIAAAVVGLSCVVVVRVPSFYPIAASQLALGFVQTVFPPCVAALSLGMVGQQRLAARIGRNESFNHAGNMLAAVLSVIIGWYVSYAGIFYFSIVQCLAIVIATLLIEERTINHDLARAAREHDDAPGSFITGLRVLFARRDIAHFTIAVALWNVANGAMLPLLGQKLGLGDVANSVVYLSICIIIAQTVMIVVAPLAGKLSVHGRKKIFGVAFALVPLRAALFALVDDRYALVSFQLIDGVGAGIYGVLSILMMADLAEGTGRFNLLQGATYAAIGLGVALSSVIGGYIAEHYGYSAAFASLGLLGVAATLFFALRVQETARIPDRTTPLLQREPR
ncbi:MAG: putative arabinose efflux permease, family [Myxococcaceae bacterium]|nr:putative arabinose efflux permease, family [Myxococcaceae bacterium]